MTYGREYKLGDKMQKQFRERGAEVSGMQASSTSELMRRAEMGRDPRVNCAEQAFRENYRKRQSSAGQNNGSSSSVGTGYNASAYSASGKRAYTGERRNASGAYRRQQSGRYNAQNTGRAYAGHSNRSSAKQRTEEYAEAAPEIRVKNKALSPMFIALLLVGTVMVMFLVFSISEVYQTTNEITRLENQLEELQNEAAELRLRLEEKNDVRKIEEIATKQLGMVKEDSLQRRYISLSDGEYIELVANENESEESTGGVLLSSIFSSLGKFFERFK